MADVAGPAIVAIKFDRDGEDAEDERVPKQEKWVKLADRRAHEDRNPREDEGKCRERPHGFPEPAFNKVLFA